MTETSSLALLDRHDISRFIFHPRSDPQPASGAALYPVSVDQGVQVVCRFFPAGKDGSIILYFHGNGETAGDYEHVAALYTGRGINLFVADYRGYGLSNGSPSFSHMLSDAHHVFNAFVALCKEEGYVGARYVMGRSLGSAPAIEVAARHQESLHGMIIESGFSDALRLLRYIGAPLHMGEDFTRGFPNGMRISEIAIPTLIIHAEEDNLIPLAEAHELHRGAAAVDKRLVVIPHADHNNLLMIGRDRYFRAVQEFISSTL